ncbi:MAG: Gfo/Idh/MocA family oxidoreductase [Bacteroidales bacterium]|nr:Gfo/Idh/MocA family oxidoreductase [Bacteroidales bacterium]
MKNDRREFLKKAALVSAGIGLSPSIIKASALGRGDFIAPSDKIKMILIGCGGQGRGDMSSFLRMNDVQVIAVCDVDDAQSAIAKKNVDNKYGNTDCKVYKDYREILEKEDTDTAILALPDHWHAITGVAVAEKKIDVYGEKPLARTIAGSRAIVNAAMENKIIWQMGSWQRSVANFHKGAELVSNGAIGKVDYAEVGLPDGGHYVGNPPVMKVPEGLDWDRWLGPAQKVPFRGVLHFQWRWIMDYSGGQLTDWAGHHIDIAHWGLGLDRKGPIQIEGKGKSNRDGIYNVPVEYDFTCVYENDIKMRVANQSKLKTGMGTCWYGSEGWLHVDRGGVIKASNENILKEKLGRDATPLYKSTDHSMNFIDCVRSRKETITPVDIGHSSITAGLLGEIAIITGQKLKWDPEKEIFIDNEQANRLLKRPYREPWQFPG